MRGFPCPLTSICFSSFFFNNLRNSGGKATAMEERSLGPWHHCQSGTRRTPGGNDSLAAIQWEVAPNLRKEERALKPKEVEYANILLDRSEERRSLSVVYCVETAHCCTRADILPASNSTCKNKQNSASLSLQSGSYHSLPVLGIPCPLQNSTIPSGLLLFSSNLANQ